MGFAGAHYTKGVKGSRGSMGADHSECKSILQKELKKLGLTGMETGVFPWEKKLRGFHLIVLTALFLCVSGFTMCMLKFVSPAVVSAVKREAQGGGGGMRLILGEDEERYSPATDVITSSMFEARQISRMESTLLCDRSSYRTDVCTLKGDIRTQASTSTILFVSHSEHQEEKEEEQKIRPYTRKWENHTMANVTELTLKRTAASAAPPCDVTHSAPALVFSTGGYTGNLFHDFTDVIVPLYITSHPFQGRVRLVVADHKPWWTNKFGDILNQLTLYGLVDFANDTRVHCFQEAVVGLSWHADLKVDPTASPSKPTIADFRHVLRKSFDDNISGRAPGRPRPKLVLIARKGSRAFLNQRQIVHVAEKLGFRVMVLSPDSNTQLRDMYGIVSSCDVFMGVHGAALTHFLFLRPGAVFVQVVPLGIEWASRTFFREAAQNVTDIHYLEYPILPEESSLYSEYPKDHPYLRNPKSVNRKGWEATKQIYLDRQNVRLSLPRFKKLLKRALELLHSNAHENA